MIESIAVNIIVPDVHGMINLCCNIFRLESCGLVERKSYCLYIETFNSFHPLFSKETPSVNQSSSRVVSTGWFRAIDPLHFVVILLLSLDLRPLEGEFCWTLRRRYEKVITVWRDICLGLTEVKIWKFLLMKKHRWLCRLRRSSFSKQLRGRHLCITATYASPFLSVYARIEFAGRKEKTYLKWNHLSCFSRSTFYLDMLKSVSLDLFWCRSALWLYFASTKWISNLYHPNCEKI